MAALELLSYQEDQRRQNAEGDEAFSRQHLYLTRIRVFRVEVLIPQLHQLEDREPAPRRVILRAETVDRTRFGQQRDDYGAKVSSLVQHKKGMLMLEGVQRGALSDQWREYLLMFAAPMRVTAAELAAAERVRRNRLLQQQQSRRRGTVTVVLASPLGEAESAARRAVIGGEQCAWMKLQSAASDVQTIRGLEAEEALERRCVRAVSDVFVCDRLCEAECCFRNRISGFEAAAREATETVFRSGGRRHEHWTIGDTLRRVTRLQEWVRAVRSGAEGRSASLAVVRAQAAKNRHRKQVAAANAAVRREHQKAVEALRKAEAAAAIDTVPDKLRRLAEAERPIRSSALSDEAWARDRIHSAFRYATVEELLIPTRRRLVAADEPSARVSTAEAQMDEWLREQRHESWCRRRLQRREGTLAAEAAGRDAVLEEEASAAHALQDRGSRSKGAAEAAARRRVLEREMLRTEHIVRQRRRREAVEMADHEGRCDLARDDSCFRFGIVETLARSGIAWVQAAEIRDMCGSVAVAHAAMYARQTSERTVVCIGAERSVRMRLEMHEALDRIRHEGDLGAALRWYFKQLERYVPQIERVQTWYRLVSAGSLGHSASMRWNRRELVRLWECREISIRRLAARLEVDAQKEKLRRAEQALVDAGAEAAREAVRMCQVYERRQRGDVWTEEGWVRRSVEWSFRSDCEATVLVDIKNAKDSQCACRRELQESETRRRRVVHSMKEDHYLSTVIRPAQRAWRCHRARERRREKIAAALVLTSTDGQTSARAAIAVSAHCGRLELAEHRDRGLSRSAERAQARDLVGRMEAVDRSRVSADVWSERLAFCVAAAESLSVAFRRTEASAFDATRHGAGFAVETLQVVLAEAEARRRIAQATGIARASVAEAQEILQRWVSAQGAFFGMERLRAAEAVADRGAVEIRLEWTAHEHHRAIFEESYWRWVVETARTADYRRMWTQSGEADGRREVRSQEMLAARVLVQDVESTERDLIDLKRERLVRSFYRQRLEGLLRVQIRNAAHRERLLLAGLTEEGAREVQSGVEQRQRERVGVDVHQSAARLRREAGRWPEVIVLFNHHEAVERARYIDGALAVHEALVTGGHGSVRALLERQESECRRGVSRSETKWRSRVYVAEESKRMHAVVLPIQRAWRQKLSRTAAKHASEHILHRRNLHLVDVHHPEEQGRKGLWEAGGRCRHAAVEAEDRLAFHRAETADAAQCAERQANREERDRTQDKELQARLRHMREEEADRCGALEEQERQQRVKHQRVSASFYVRECRVAEETGRAAVARSEKVCLWHLGVYSDVRLRLLRVCAGERSGRQGTEEDETDLRAALRQHEQWMRTARGEVELEEIPARLHVEGQQRAARKLFFKLETGRRSQIDSVRLAAEKIQMAWRRYYAIALVEAMQALRVEALVEQEAALRDEAAATLQAHWVGYTVRSCGLLDLLRKEWEEARVEAERREREHAAASTIQRAILQHNWRQPRVRDAVAEADALRRERDDLLSMRDFVEELHDAAGRVQSLWRMHQVRRYFVEATFGGEWA